MRGFLEDSGESLARFEGCWIGLKRWKKGQTTNSGGIGGKAKRRSVERLDFADGSDCRILEKVRVSESYVTNSEPDEESFFSSGVAGGCGPKSGSTCVQFCFSLLFRVFF